MGRGGLTHGGITYTIAAVKRKEDSHMDISRRGFLSSAGGLVAAAALPAIAKDDPKLFPGRGGYERLMLAYQHVHIGLSKPFSILHISDTHLTETHEGEPEALRKFCEARRRTFGGRQEAALRSSLAWARANVDYVLHTGDLIDFQSEANFDLVREYYGESARFMFGSTGNHEYQRRAAGEPIRNTFEYNEVGRPGLARSFPFDTVFHSTVATGVNFITIEQVYGFVTAAQVERFHAEVKKGLPIVLCMHVPFFTDLIWRATVKFWHNRDRKFTTAALPDPSGDFKRQREDPVTRDFLAYLRGEPLLKAVLSGHMHFACQERFSPTAMQYVVGGNFMFHGQEIFFT